ncbi:tetratricopeptide repeat protein [bacterium]|nr:tetratricopeptide repeat protein [bacterium]
MKRSIQLGCAILLISVNAFGQTKIEQAKILFEQRKYNKVKEMLTPVGEKDPDFAAAQYYLGRIALDEKENSDAIDFFEEAVNANDKVADYHHWLGNAYRNKALTSNPLVGAMLAPKIRKAWEKAAALDAKNIDARISLIGYYTEAPGFMGGSTDKAKEAANQLIKLDPAIGHREMGEIYMVEKNYEKALVLFEEALKESPEDYVSNYHYGKASALSGQSLERGEECLKKYLAHTPQSGEPSHAGANMRLAQIKEKMGDKADAKKLYRIALELDNSLKEAKEGFERVSK